MLCHLRYATGLQGFSFWQTIMKFGTRGRLYRSMRTEPTPGLCLGTSRAADRYDTDEPRPAQIRNVLRRARSSRAPNAVVDVAGS
jgi:hypothetical protein